MEGSPEQRGGDDLLRALAELAREFAEADTLDETLQRIVDRAESYLPHCHGASRMLIRSREDIATPAFSSETAHRSDLAQYEAGEGPCLGAICEQRTLVIDDLLEEERWPAWRERVRGLGISSMVSFRLFLAGGHDGRPQPLLRRTGPSPRCADVERRIGGGEQSALGGEPGAREWAQPYTMRTTRRWSRGGRLR